MGFGVIFVWAILSFWQTAYADFTSRFPAVLPSIQTQIFADTHVEKLRRDISTIASSCIPQLESKFGRTWARTVAADGSTNLAGFEGLSLVLTKGTASCGGHACTGGYGNKVAIEFNIQSSISGYRNLTPMVCHELVHAYFRRFLTRLQYAALPRWAREGSAVYLANQIGERISIALVRDFDNPTRSIDGLSGTHDFDDYLEDGLAFAWMDSQKTDGAVVVLNRVLQGRSIAEAIQDELNISEDRFYTLAHDYAVAQVTGEDLKRPENLRQAMRIMKAPDTRDYALAKSLFLQVLADRGIVIHPDGSLNGAAIDSTAALALFELASRIWSGSEWKPEGLAQAVLERVAPEQYASLIANLHYARAGALLRVGRHNEALLEYSRVYLLHLESPNLRLGSAMGIARSYFELAEYAEAARWLNPQKDDKTYVGEEIRYKLGYSFYKTCLEYEGLTMLKDLARREHTTFYVKEARAFLQRVDAGQEKNENCARTGELSWSPDNEASGDQSDFVAEPLPHL